LPAPTVAREVQAGSLVALPFADERLVRPLGVLTRRGKRQHQTTRHLLDFLRESAPVLARTGLLRPLMPLPSMGHTAPSDAPVPHVPGRRFADEPPIVDRSSADGGSSRQQQPGGASL
jgi:hypothetical protein